MKLQIFGAHPHGSSVSMNIYRNSIEPILARVNGEELEIDCWPRGQVVGWRKKNVLPRLIGKYLEYPLRVLFSTNAETIHFLDHSSAYLIPFAKFRGKKVLVTLHDLIPLRFPGGMTPVQVRRFQKNVNYLKSADKVISVSDYTKREAVELLGIDPDKIIVNPCGCPDLAKGEDDRISPPLRGLKSEDSIVIFSIGSELERKNLQFLPEVLKELSQRSDKKITLLRAGDFLSNELREKLEDVLVNGELIELGFVSEAKKNECYRVADVVFFPSLYEGFGLPVIEAFAHGTAVACSDQSSLPEVGGDLAHYFPPSNINEAVEAVISAANSNEQVQKQARINYSKSFSWEKHVQKIIEVATRLRGS